MIQRPRRRWSGHQVVQVVRRTAGKLSTPRTFAGRLCCALALAVAGLNATVVDAPTLMEAGQVPALLGTAAVILAVGYLAVCGVELLLGTVHPPAGRSAPSPLSGTSSTRGPSGAYGAGPPRTNGATNGASHGTTNGAAVTGAAVTGAAVKRSPEDRPAAASHPVR